MKALVYYGTGKERLRLEEISKPKIQNPDDVLIKVHYAGVCGSEIARTVGDYPIPLNNPVPHGHEFSGVVEEIGENVSTIAVGDRVAVAPRTVCGTCFNCLNNQVGQCENTKGFIGVKLAGGWAEYTVVEESNVVKLPEGLGTFEGAFLEPLSVAVHSFKLIDFEVGQSCAVLGVGTIGMLTLQVAKTYGAGNLTAIDIDESRLELAEQNGAQHSINTKTDWRKKALEITEGKLFETVMETGGVVYTTKAAIELAGAHSTVVFVGTPSSDICFTPQEFEQINRKELWIRGAWQSYSTPFPGSEWIESANLLASGQVRLDALVDRVIPIEEIFDALNDAKKGKLKGKIMLKIAPDADKFSRSVLVND